MEHTGNKHVDKVKKVFDENNLDLLEQKLDSRMEKLAHLKRVQQIINHKYMEDILASDFVHRINAKMYPHLKTIFLVIWWISVVSGIIGIFSFLLGLSGLGFVFSFGLGIGVRIVIYLLVALLLSLLSLCCGIGMIKMKKRLPPVILISFVVTIVGFIIALIPSGFIIGAKYGSFGGSFLNLILFFALVVIVFKNKELFHR